MKKIVVKEVFWQCSVCKTKHQNKKDAKKCEAKPVEDKIFKKGDKVRIRFVCYCDCAKVWRPTGTIVKIEGPQCPDEEYEYKWLNRVPGRRPNSQHVYWYEVKYRCPECKSKSGKMAYAPELEKIRE